MERADPGAAAATAAVLWQQQRPGSLAVGEGDVSPVKQMIGMNPSSASAASAANISAAEGMKVQVGSGPSGAQQQQTAAGGIRLQHGPLMRAPREQKLNRISLGKILWGIKQLDPDAYRRWNQQDWIGAALDLYK
jgi:hypothetical protein